MPSLYDRLPDRLGNLAVSITQINADQFLCGPDGDPDRVVIDDIFAVPFNTVLKDWWTYDCRQSEAEMVHRHIGKLATDPEFLLHQEGSIIYVEAREPDLMCSSGVLALRDTGDLWDLVGVYLGHNIAVHPDAQREGIGRSLVIERFLCDGAIPAWDEDKPGFSHLGHATHVSAFGELQAAAQIALDKKISPDDNSGMTP